MRGLSARNGASARIFPKTHVRRSSRSGTDRPIAPASRQASRSAAARVFSTIDLVAQRDARTGCGRAGQPPPAPATRDRIGQLPPRRSRAWPSAGGPDSALMIPACVSSLALIAGAFRHPGLSASRPSRNAPSSPGGIRASRPGLPLTLCAVDRRRRAPCGTHDRQGCQRHGNPGRPCWRQ